MFFIISAIAGGYIDYLTDSAFFRLLLGEIKDENLVLTLRGINKAVIIIDNENKSEDDVDDDNCNDKT